MATAGSSPRVRGTRTSSSRRVSPWSVHPRVCGELLCRAADDGQILGSSPRVRGTPARRPRGSGLGRFIPACAGNSGLRRAPAIASPVHPRVCGELVGKDGDNVWVDGSSPRVRGTQWHRNSRAAPTRFIPACAGNSPVRLAVHAGIPGSSPRVRGTPRRPLPVPRVLRFIPACAGNSVRHRKAHHAATVHPRVCGELADLRIAAADISEVHPRVCGELRCAGSSLCRTCGSSPRVRGTRLTRRWTRLSPPVHPRVCGELPRAGRIEAADRRFIPACAGNSANSYGTVCIEDGSSPRVRGTPGANGVFRSHWAVHPRVCGELYSELAEFAVHAGSSPRVRGTHGDPPQTLRILPVHPRVCGELRGAGGLIYTFYGSSPRVRGTLNLYDLYGAPHRFIPACAGNSDKPR